MSNEIISCIYFISVACLSLRDLSEITSHGNTEHQQWEQHYTFETLDTIIKPTKYFFIKCFLFECLCDLLVFRFEALLICVFCGDLRAFNGDWYLVFLDARFKAFSLIALAAFFVGDGTKTEKLNYNINITQEVFKFLTIGMAHSLS